MNSYRVIDCDGHVAEPFEMYTNYIDPKFRDSVPKRIDVDGHRFVVVNDQVLPGFVKLGGKPLGGAHVGRELPRPVQREDIAKGGSDPNVRVGHMDIEGIDLAVLYPSGTVSMCGLPSVELEAALYRAYNRWLADYCAIHPDRLKGVAVVCMRDIELGVEELRLTAKEPWMVGVLCPPHIADKNLDDSAFYPLWEVAQEFDLPICLHAGCGRPPYALGTYESSDNLFMMHSMAHPFEQMRAVAAVIGGGVLDAFPRLRFGFMEAGIGWVPWWIERLAEHAEKLPGHVPAMKRAPEQYIEAGQCFFSCEPDEQMLEAAIAQMGDDWIVYPSDYPHWDCSYPDSVRNVTKRASLSDKSKAKILGENALKLYPRLIATTERKASTASSD